MPTRNPLPETDDEFAPDLTAALSLGEIAPSFLPQDDETLGEQPGQAIGEAPALDSVAQDSVVPEPELERQSTWPFEGNIDMLRGGALYLWCQNLEDPDKAVTVDLIVNGRLFGRYLANEFRPDLAAAGKGSGYHGLTVDLTGSNLLSSSKPVTFAAYSATVPGSPFATIEVQPSLDEQMTLPAGILEHTRTRALRLSDAIYGQSLTGWGPAAAISLAGKAAAPLIAPAAIQGAGRRNVRVSSYADFTRKRMREEETFDLGQASVQTDHFLKWYLDFYSHRRSTRRAPLSAEEITYLNELVTFGGQEYQLSRVTWMFLLDEPGLLASLNLKSADCYIEIAYWWAIERSRGLWVEDCLVHPNYIQALGSVGERWRLSKYPLSRFMEFYFNRQVEWHFLSLENEPDRAVYYILLFLTALQNPTVLQYMPRIWTTKILQEHDGNASIFARLLDQILKDDAALRYLKNYGAVIRDCGFDIERMRSASLTTDGHRVANFGLRREAVLLEPVSVQVIGPLQKASGLGQATRLSYDAIARHFPDCSGYDFDMDNPAPVGFNPERPSSPLRRAKINLIHLNAESIPLAFAYLPDVFTGSYNIGYFFWELDTPASCHGLALELLDEIWVAAEYGVQQYRPFTKLPITKVGMSYENIPIPARDAARRFLISRLGCAPDSFVFLAAFDSFSFIQRKNPQGVVRAFLDAFPNEPRARLVLKTHNRDFVHDPVQRRIWQMLDEAVAMDPRITILNETLPYEQLLLLKAGSDCYVSLHRSEGWGFGMLEAMHIGIPVLATDYSGNTEFCSSETAWTVASSLVPMAPGDYIFVRPGQHWAEPSHTDAVHKMRNVFEDADGRRNRVASAKAFVDRQFSPDAVAQRYADRLHAITAAHPGPGLA